MIIMTETLNVFLNTVVGCNSWHLNKKTGLIDTDSSVNIIGNTLIYDYRNDNGISNKKKKRNKQIFGVVGGDFCYIQRMETEITLLPKHIKGDLIVYGSNLNRIDSVKNIILEGDFKIRLSDIPKKFLELIIQDLEVLISEGFSIKEADINYYT
jgi:hypothetical protein